MEFSSDELFSARMRAMEELLLTPAVRSDRALAESLLAEDFVEFGASGRIWSREQILDLLQAEEYRSPAVEQFACQRISEDVALLTYRAVRIDPETKERSASLRSSLWVRDVDGVRNDEAWRMRFHQGTRIPA